MRHRGRWLVIGAAIAVLTALLVPEVSAAADPDVTLSALVSSFGTQLVGVKSDALSVTITNSGTAPLAISNVHIEGDDAADFGQGLNCPVSPDTVPAGGSCTVDVSFTPSSAGVKSAQLMIGDNAPSSWQTVTLTGTGLDGGQLLPPTDLGLPPGTYFSDDFESGSLTRWGTLSSSDSTITPDATTANSGNGSVRVTNNSNDQYSRLMADLAGGGHAQSYTRFCFRIAPGQTDGVEIANGRAIDDEYPLGIRRFVIDYNPAAKGLEGYFFNEDLQRLDMTAADGQVETGRWYCAELYLDERADGHAKLWLDGTPVGAVDGDLSTPNPYSRFYLWNQADAGTVSFDDVTVADAPIGPVGAGTAALPGPAAAVGPGSVDFGEQTTRSRSAERAVTLTNTGTSAMTVHRVFVAGDDANDFQQTDDCPATLAAGATCSATVTFTPTAAGARDATLSFDDDAPGSPQSVPLTGTGVGGGVATLSTQSLSFDDRVVDTRSEAQGVRITNTGTAPLVISNFHIEGDDAGAFAQGANCPVSPDALAVGASCEVDVSFGPGSSGSKSASLVIVDNDASGSQSVALSGRAVTGFPDIGLSADSVAFGEQPAGARSDGSSVTLTNTGAAPLTLSNFHLEGPDASDFSYSFACPVSPDTLAVGASCTVDLAFTPDGAGARSAQLVIGDNAPSRTQSVALTGSGVTGPKVGLTHDSMNFGATTTQSVSAARPVTVTNTAHSAATLGSIALTGANADDFADTSDCPLSPATLAAGASCTVDVTFTPSATGDRSASLVVKEAGDDTGQSVAVSGLGVAAGTYFRDDFESGSLGRWNTLSSSDSTITPDTTTANSGSGSVRVTNNSNDQYSRLMADLAGGGHAQSYTHFCFRVAPGQTEGVEIANGRAIDDEYPLGIRRFVIDYNPAAKGLEAYFFNEDLQRLDMYAADGQVETGRWYCAELYLDERADGHAKLWLDGTLVGAVDGDLSTPNPYSRFYLWNQAGAGTVSFDDVTVADTPTGPTPGGL